MPELPSPCPVTQQAPSKAQEAIAHFEKLLSLETDCSDVFVSQKAGAANFILMDVRSPELFSQGHIPGAINLPHARIAPHNLERFGDDQLFVVYCAGPHCNGADKAALRLARMGRPVKKMIGGITGWIDEGLPLIRETP